MLLIHCPYCSEDRPEVEFRHAGQAHVVRSSELTSVSDEDFARFLYIRDNPKGIVFERWRHIHGCGRFFNAARDTVSDKFITVYKAGEPKPDLNAVQQTPSAASAPVAAAKTTVVRATRAKKKEA